MLDFSHKDGTHLSQSINLATAEAITRALGELVLSTLAILAEESLDVALGKVLTKNVENSEDRTYGTDPVLPLMDQYQTNTIVVYERPCKVHYGDHELEAMTLIVDVTWPGVLQTDHPELVVQAADLFSERLQEAEGNAQVKGEVEKHEGAV